MSDVPVTIPLRETAAFRLLGRAGYGAAPGQAARTGRGSLRDWVEEQLAHPANEPRVEARLERLSLPLRYHNGMPEQFLDARASFETLPASQAWRWALTDARAPIASQERDRPFHELSTASLARKVLAGAQLRERMVEFWHDHFSVAASASTAVSISLPAHDLAIRSHALGNFRALLEAMTTSPAMLSYLSNRSSRAGSPNENYARELLELHTLGRQAYLGARAAENPQEGYGDGDVWEAARALTGWTLADGTRIDSATVLPRTGEFVFIERWHDGYQKRFLGHALTPFQPPMAHGRAVLDSVAVHPATAQHIATKLAHFLIGPRAGPAAIARASESFRRHADAPDQMARVLRALLLGPEVIDPSQGRVRRPLDVAVAAMRGLEITPQPTHQLLGWLGEAGQRLFNWPSPDGQTLAPEHYLTTSALRTRWSMLMNLATNTGGNGAALLPPKLAGRGTTDTLKALAEVLLGDANAPAIGIIAQRLPASAALPQERDVATMAGWLMLSPAFQST